VVGGAGTVFSPRTDEAYVGWIKRYVLFHGKQHPATWVVSFLTHLAVARRVRASTQDQAASALLFLIARSSVFRSRPGGAARPREPRRLPVVLTRREVAAALAELSGLTHLVASLLYGSDLRLLEALQLRVRDILRDQRRIAVRCAKAGTTG
jgi:integrase